MANKKYEEADVQAIATAIREKTGTEDTYKVSDMAEGVNEVYEAGKTDEWSEFWKRFTNNGQREEYRCAFEGANMTGVEIDAELCKPVRTGHIFYDSKMTELPKGINFSKRDTTTSTLSWYGAIGREFGWCTNITYVYDIGIQPSASLASMFTECRRLETIEIIRSKEETLYDGTFGNCHALKNITFEGEIGKNISFAYSPLSVESMKNIILHLANYTGTSNAGAYTLTLKDECKTAMAELGAIPELNNKTYTEYLADIGWVLA